jgi:hypothetical protein
MHCAHKCGLVADERNVDRIAGVPVAGVRAAVKLSEERVMAVIKRSEPRHDEIGRDGPGERDEQECLGIGNVHAALAEC